MKLSDKEILEKAIQKAIDGGWRGDILDIKVEAQDDGLVRLYWDNTEWSVLDIIFNHDFAKALWGEKLLDIYYDDNSNNYEHMGGKLNYPYNEGAGMEYTVASWKFNLQQMVISDDPVKYLGDNI